MSDDPVASSPLWSYFREVRAAVELAHQGGAEHPYRNGDFLVRAEADEVELTIRDVSEEDAILIAGELAERGARTSVRLQRTCPSCQRRVPDQAYCVHCRSALVPL